MSKYRSPEDIPTKGQVVVIQSAQSAYNGSAGYVTSKTASRSARPYTVKFNDGATKKFRVGDVILAE